MVHAVVVVLLDDEVGGVQVIHPGGNLLVVLALAGDGVDQHRAADVHTAKETDLPDHTGTDPEGGALVIDLHHRLGEHVGGVVETQMPVEVAAQVLGGGVLDALSLGQAHQLGALGHHIHQDIGGQALGAVGEPADQVGVHEGGDADGAALVVDLGVVVHHLKLADHIAELAQLPVAQPLGGVPVQHGDLVVGDLRHLGGEVALLKGQELGVALGAEDDGAHQSAHQSGGQQEHRQEEGDGTLFPQELEVVAEALPLEAGGDDGADAVHRAQ